MRTSTGLLICLVIGLTGCGGAADGMQVVRGEVTLDGQPIEKGRILFRQIAGDQRAYAGEIVDGKYQVRAEEGRVKVEILASRLIPGKFDHSNGTPEPMGEMYIPAKYNSRTELTAEITAAGSNRLPFQLTSK